MKKEFYVVYGELVDNKYELNIATYTVRNVELAEDLVLRQGDTLKEIHSSGTVESLGQPLSLEVKERPKGRYHVWLNSDGSVQSEWVPRQQVNYVREYDPERDGDDFIDFTDAFK